MEGNFLDLPLTPMQEHDLEAAYQAIFSMFSKLAPDLPPGFYARFRKITYAVTFLHNQVIIDYGQVCRHTYLMLSGFVRSTKILKSRGETVVWFLRGGDIMIAIDSFYTQTESDEKLTALQDTFTIALPWKEHQALYQDFPEFNRLARLLTEQYYRQAMERTTWFYESPEVRYEKVLRYYPTIAEHVSLTELASYLGIARETLSRIRRRIARKGKPPRSE